MTRRPRARSCAGRACALAVLLALRAQGAAADDGALAERARTLVGADQGVYVEDDAGSVLVAQAATRPVHPASVSKVATTLALLRTLGPGHRFATRFLGSGAVRGGVLGGDLVVESEGDPFFVDENALLVLLALRERGIERVAGRLVVRGPLLFDWSADEAAARLRRALEGAVPSEAWAAVRATQSNGGERAPGLRFGDGSTQGASAPSPEAHARALVIHRSETLVPLVKALNGYSNNIFHPFAERAGGVSRVEQIARESVPPALRAEIVIQNGAGAGSTNRLSPRAAVALLRALHDALGQHGLALDDVLPVSGVDPGTLRARLDGPGERGRIAGKTGTYGDYGASALVGVIRTGERGLVYFALLNHGVPVPEARARQDAFARALLAAKPGPAWEHPRDDTPAFTRARIDDGATAASAGEEKEP